VNPTINDWLRTILFLPPQASTVAPAIDHLHYFVIITTMVGATGVALLAMWWLVRYRRRAPLQEPPPEEPAPSSIGLELGIITGLFLLFLAWWLVGFLQYLRVRVPPEDTYDIYVTAKQWMWKFAYVEGNQTIAQLYVPAGKPVKLIMTSRDVIHSFFVPDFRLKMDVIPGRYTTLWFEAREPGTHPIYCAEYCGTQHSTMRAEVIVLDQADFGRWLAAGQRERAHAPTPSEPSVVGELGPAQPMPLRQRGELVAAREGCLRCHTLNGQPHIAPTFAGMYRSRVPLAGGGEIVADDDYLTESMMDPLAKIHAGFVPVMPSYFGRLPPAEVAALLELIHSLGETPEKGTPP
jgi:cytochrome c oxidase subunit 2